MLYSRNVSDGAGNGGISPSRMAVRAERIRMASISLSESNEKRNRVDDNGDDNGDDNSALLETLQPGSFIYFHAVNNTHINNPSKKTL